MKAISRGVPQGSVIGPVLFLCYINDIVEIANTNDIGISLYADDAVLFCTSSDAILPRRILQDSLDQVASWCKKNHINLMLKKLNSVVMVLEPFLIRMLSV